MTRFERQREARRRLAGMLRGRPTALEGERTFTGSCPIREHTGDGAYVGRCEFATYDGFCPRHGALEDYATNDGREVRVEDRRHAATFPPLRG